MFSRSLLFRPSSGSLLRTHGVLGVSPVYRSTVCSVVGSRAFHSSKYAMVKDYYKTLGVTRSATKDEIKKSFRSLAMKYHPDVNKDNKAAENKFKEISEAYEVLEDDKKRQQYDAFGHDGVDLSGNGNGMDPNNPFEGFGFNVSGLDGQFINFNMNGAEERVIFEMLKNMHIPNEVVFEEDFFSNVGRGKKGSRRRKNKENDFFEDMGFSVFDIGTVYKSGGKKKPKKANAANAAKAKKK